MKKHLNLKQKAYDLAMDKVEKYLEAKAKKKPLNGPKEAYAANIMYLVS